MSLLQPLYAGGSCFFAEVNLRAVNGILESRKVSQRITLVVIYCLIIFLARRQVSSDQFLKIFKSQPTAKVFAALGEPC